MWLALGVVAVLVFAILLLPIGAPILVAAIVPALLLVGAGLFMQFKGIRTGGDKTGRLEKGPDSVTGAAGPEDAPGGPTHATRGPAHGGQANMTP